MDEVAWRARVPEPDRPYKTLRDSVSAADYRVRGEGFNEDGVCKFLAA